MRAVAPEPQGAPGVAFSDLGGSLPDQPLFNVTQRKSAQLGVSPCAARTTERLVRQATSDQQSSTRSGAPPDVDETLQRMRDRVGAAGRTATGATQDDNVSDGSSGVHQSQSGPVRTLQDRMATAKKHGPQRGVRDEGLSARAKRASHVALRQTEGEDGEHKIEPKTIKTSQALFVDEVTKRKEMLKELESGNGPRAVTEFYKDDDHWAVRIATNDQFNSITMTIIFLNFLFIGWDADSNDAPCVTQSEPWFMIPELFFCVFYVVEGIIRVEAFEYRTDIFKDRMTTFDLVLVIVQITDITMNEVSYALGMESSGEGLKLLKTLRLMRLTRTAKLVKRFPELMALLGGMIAAMRAVSWTLVLLLAELFTFGLVFRVQAGTPLDLEDENSWDSVLSSMTVLMCAGSFLDGIYEVITVNVPTGLLPLFVLHILLSHFCLMHVLIGIICEIVGVVNTSQMEHRTMEAAKTTLMNLFKEVDMDGNEELDQQEFLDLLEQPATVALLQSMDIDIPDFIGLSDFIFEEKAAATGLESPAIKFVEFMELLLSLRTSNPVRVMDIVDLRKLVFRLGDGIDDIRKTVCPGYQQGFSARKPDDEDGRKPPPSEDRLRALEAQQQELKEDVRRVLVAVQQLAAEVKSTTASSTARPPEEDDTNCDALSAESDP